MKTKQGTNHSRILQWRWDCKERIKVQWRVIKEVITVGTTIVRAIIELHLRFLKNSKVLIIAKEEGQTITYIEDTIISQTTNTNSKIIELTIREQTISIDHNKDKTIQVLIKVPILLTQVIIITKQFTNLSNNSSRTITKWTSTTIHSLKITIRIKIWCSIIIMANTSKKMFSSMVIKVAHRSMFHHFTTICHIQPLRFTRIRETKLEVQFINITQ